MSNQYYTLKDVSCLLKTPIPYLRKMIKDHNLKAHFIGRQYIVSQEDLKKCFDTLGVKNEK